MSAFEIIVTCFVAGAWAAVLQMNYRLTKMEKVRKKFYQQAASPDKIVEDMERSASFVESKLSAPERTTQPRTDQQGQHAVIHRPKQIGPKVTFPRKKYP